MPSGLILSEGETPYLHLLAVESDDGIEKLYEEISEILHQERRGKVNAIVIGNFNSIVGEGSTDKLVEPFGLGRRNEQSMMLIDFSNMIS